MEQQDGFRLSPQQEQIWRLARQDQGPYRVQGVLSLRGALDTGVLEAALREVVEHHEILRTGYPVLAGFEFPFQVIEEPPMAGPLLEHGAAAGEEALDLERGPLLRARLVKEEAELYRLYLELPALSADARSMACLAEELAATYGARCEGAAPVQDQGGNEDEHEDEDEIIQYADAAEWQHELLESGGEEARKFWRELDVFADLHTLSSLEQPAPDSPFVPRRQVLEMAPGLVSALEALAQGVGAEPATLVQVVWQALLGRLAEGAGTVVGIAFSGRRYEGLEDALGLFVRHLPLRWRPSPETSLLGALSEVVEKLADLEGWQETFHWDHLSRESHEGSPFVPYAYEHLEDGETVEVAGVRFTLDDSQACTGRFRLKLVCRQRAAGWATEIHSDASAIEAADAERLIHWLHALLERAVAAPDKPLATLEMLSEAEQRWIERWNETGVEQASPGAHTLGAFFEHRARQVPDAVALVFGDEYLTYSTLEARSRRLAHGLRERGIGPEVSVGLAMDRSLQMIVALLGITRAGGPWVPIDPTYPENRREFMAQDSQLTVLLEDGSEWPEPESTAAASIPATDPDSMAYTLYTSGTTGRPKGVMVSHRAILNRLLWMQRRFPLGDDDGVLFKTPHSFDASIWEIFVPLLAGARVVVARPGGHQDGGYLEAAIQQHRITVVQMVPSLLAVFLEEEHLETACRSLRRFFCGGEALAVDSVERFYERFGASLCNLYGPTEAAIDASFLPCEPGRWSERTPIGQPLDNVEIHLLDPRGGRVPPGLTGELHIGGTSLARGYLGRPGLTAERFVPHPWSRQPGGRLYRSGDLARIGDGDQLDFLGRIDSQVKIRGVRIELGEIEARLRAEEGVREVVVVLGEQLVAYVVARQGQTLDTDALRRSLEAHLPDQMVPQAFVLLPELPRLPNGKLDRASLPQPGEDSLGQRAPYVAPRNHTEELLAALWADQLGVERVGAEDSFFQLGGHSLVAIRLLSRIRRSFGVELAVRELFEAPRLADLARHIEVSLKTERRLPPPIEPLLRDRRFPLSFSQQRLWFLQELEPRSTAYHQPGALHFRGPFQIAHFRRAVHAIVERHESLRTVFPAAEGEAWQKILPPSSLEVPLLDVTGLDPAARDTWLLELIHREGARPFDMAQGPLLRILVVRLDAEHHVLCFNLHHIISDGWSVGILVAELAAFYGGAGAELPELPVQYPDYAQWQREWLRDDVLEDLVGYWRERLTGAPDLVEISLDRPRPALQSYRGETRRHELSVDLSRALEEFSRHHSVTLYITLLCAFKSLLRRYGAGTDLVVGTHIANRNQHEIEGLIGFFVNALVLRTDLSGRLTLIEALERVRETVLGAFSHQELPFDRVVEEMQPRRDLSATPLFQIAFDMDQPEAVPLLELPEIHVAPVELPNPTAKFDLNLMADRLPEGGISLAVEYSTDLWDRSTMLRLLTHFENLLRAAVEAPERDLFALPMLTPAEHHQLRFELQGPVRRYPIEHTLHRLFEDQAQRVPDRLAAVDGERRLSYGALEVASARLAVALRRVGVGAGTVVGLLEERGLELLVGIVAILRAGGAYVPFDPTYPADRLRGMLQDSGVATLLSRSAHLESLRDLPALERVFCFDRPLEGEDPSSFEVVVTDDLPVSSASETAALPAGDPRDPAYMLYTSGSTGRPKGAVIRHDGKVNHIYAQIEALGLTEDFRFLQSAPSSSDISVWQFLGPLLLGGQTVIVDLETVSDPSLLLRVLQTARITLAELVPEVLRGLIEEASRRAPEERSLEALGFLMATGEAVPVELVNAWLDLWPEIGVVNAYGPTEAADDVTQELIRRPLPADGKSLSIGRPLANLDCHVLDERFGLVPLGVPGELAIGGVGVGLGYLDRAVKTATSFAPHPFADTAGETFYRTGDLVRWSTDGRLDFLGRIDHQVQLRGFRIELGEIEAALERQPTVARAVVVLGGEGREKALIAYLVPADGAPPEDELQGILRSQLREVLPSHMIPAALVVLDQFPLTPAGKIDRRALPAPGALAQVSLVPPRTAEEETLATIWAEVLGLDEVGVETDFFQLGGHSLLAVQVLSRIRTAFDVELPLREFFNHTTIAELAPVVARAVRQKRPSKTPALARVKRRRRRVTQKVEGLLESTPSDHPR